MQVIIGQIEWTNEIRSNLDGRNEPFVIHIKLTAMHYALYEYNEIVPYCANEHAPTRQRATVSCEIRHIHV